MVLRWIGALLVIGCGAPQAVAPPPRAESPEATTPEAAPSPATPVSTRPQIPRCGAPEAPPLTSFSDLRSGDGTLHHVVVSHGDGGWSPVEPVDMPMHHATALTWTNLADFQTLGDSQAEQLRFTFTPLSRTQVHRAAENVFFTTYRARVEQLCSTSASETRPEGALLASIGLDTAMCSGLEDAVREAAREVGSCTSHAQCTIVDVGVCGIEGLGCHWIAAHRERDRSDLVAALQALASQPCPISSCDCPVPPTAARCRAGHCVAR